MQFFYADESGACVGSFDGPPEQSPFPGTPVSIAPIDGGSQRWNGSAWEWPTDVLKAQLVTAIEARHRQALEAGLAYGESMLQIREQDQINLTAMGNEARWALLGNIAWDAGFAWRMANNEFMSVPTPQAMIAMAEAARVEVLRLHHVRWGHLDQLRQLSTAAEIANYDIDTGW